MTVLVTGATGYLGSYLVHGLLERGQQVTALVRAGDADAARVRLWRSLQLHMSGETLLDHLEQGRLRFVRGDIREPRLGLEPRAYKALVSSHDAVVHAAATLNRRSSRACVDVNLRGGLEVLRLAQRIHERDGLRRFVFVSTSAVAGKRSGELVQEDQAIEWDRSDWDPYARTKKFGEHLVSELLPDASTVIVRPSIVLGDSRFPETTQFDMVRAFVTLARLPVLPFRPDARLDIVPADYVADATVALTLAEAPRHRVYHLTSGAASPTYREVTSAVPGRRVYVPRLSRPLALGLKGIAAARMPLLAPVRGVAALMDAFWPYLEWDVVFDNTRTERETGLIPKPFPSYCAGLMRFALEGRFRYSYRPLSPALADCNRGELGQARLPLAHAPAPAGRGCS